MSIPIRPYRYRQFGDPKNIDFCFVTNSEFSDSFTLDGGGLYQSVKIYQLGPGDSFLDLLKIMPEPAHILVITPLSFFTSPSDEQVGHRKILVMPCSSTPVSIEDVAYFVDVLEKTDPAQQESFAERFFSIGENSPFLTISDCEYQSKANFQHLDDSYEWFEQAGYLGWGEQQMVPSGEISCLPLNIHEFSERHYFEIEGEIAFKGCPIVHSGGTPFEPEDQLRVYNMLSAIEDDAVIATVKKGKIERVEPSHERARPAAKIFEELFERDSKYRTIWEVGFGMNPEFNLLKGNFSMNEVYGSKNGAIHFGLGLMPFTQYHIDIICPNLVVTGLKDQALIGIKSNS